MTAPATLTPVAGFALLERATAYTLVALRRVTDGALARPTPCAGWSLRDLLVHMDDSLTAMDEAMRTGTVLLDDVRSPRVAGSPSAGELVGRLKDRACRMVGAWTAAGEDPVPVRLAGGGAQELRLTAGVVAAAGAVDVAVHGWDVARACGSRHPVPGALAADLLQVCALVVTDDDRPHRFGPVVPLPRGASPGDRLLAHLGRHP